MCRDIKIENPHKQDQDSIKTETAHKQDWDGPLATNGYNIPTLYLSISMICVQCKPPKWAV